MIWIRLALVEPNATDLAKGDVGRRGHRCQPQRKPLVRITRLEPEKRRIAFGLLKGRIKVPRDFDEPLPDDVLASFQGR